jgi:cellulose synthase/poly-beta-1,6-N-acetylglucosamine synthase-like glycosyltransferase
VSRHFDKAVILRRYEGRIGKTACLNRAVPLAKGEIIVFSDANSLYSRNAMKELIKHFTEKEIGFVTGTTRYVCGANGEKLESVGLYGKLENFVKSLESRIGSCVGADGAIFAIRKELYQSLRDADINDLVVPFTVIKQGFRGILENEAYCVEKTARNFAGEFRRQVRISNRTIRAIINNGDLINPIRYGLFSFELLSHKICKLLIPFWFILLFISSLACANHGSWYTFVLCGEFGFLGMACLGHLKVNYGKLSRAILLSYSFVLVNSAIFLGWVKYFKGETYKTWSTFR